MVIRRIHKKGSVRSSKEPTGSPRAERSPISEKIGDSLQQEIQQETKWFFQQLPKPVLIYVPTEWDVQQILLQMFNSSPSSILTINPYDQAIIKTGYPSRWMDQTYQQQENSFKREIRLRRKMFKEIYSFFEISQAGRFHFHALVTYDDIKDFHYLTKSFEKVYSKRGNSKAVNNYPTTESFIKQLSNKQTTIGIHYLTKDYSYMLTKGTEPFFVKKKTSSIINLFSAHYI